ncbi:spore protease YyaC [Lederbergia lenta]|uniref:spore protease YyaC n=1 Tax=Lederbergia lenta TaxID=1467 RepID=UPI00203AD177|nr:spore protease YyaC [Lederbergia lenta]MCM3112775.1 spore protease YyaC [Lederbergia lenta]
MKSHPLFGAQDQNEIRVKFDDKGSKGTISEGIGTLLPFSKHRTVGIVCIGTDRSTGDSLGPLVGTFLKEAGLKRFQVYGTLEDPVHAVNLEEKLQLIHDTHFRPFIIGIDACLGKLNSIGSIKVGIGPVKPGSAVNKDLTPVGDIHITGIVNVGGYMELFVLQNTRLSLVMSMAKQIAAAIIEADKAYYENKKSYLQLEWDMERESHIK